MGDGNMRRMLEAQNNNGKDTWKKKKSKKEAPTTVQTKSEN